MFSTSPMMAVSPDVIDPTYRGPVIDFGGSFSSLCEEWAEWLFKFEELLRHHNLASFRNASRSSRMTRSAISTCLANSGL